MPALPARPSQEHLRKTAKRRARERSLPLAEAQRSLAVDHGFRTWAALMDYVARARGDAVGWRPSLLAAVRAGDIDAVRELLSNGANPNVGNGRDLPLHVAARRGPLGLVETLIAGGALEWQKDAAGATALDAARSGRTPERRAIVALLDRTSIGDPTFRAAVDAIHSGDVTELSRLLDAHPGLLHVPISGPEAYRKAHRHQYFIDLMLFWFVAFNPAIAARMPPNITETTHGKSGARGRIATRPRRGKSAGAAQHMTFPGGTSGKGRTSHL